MDHILKCHDIVKTNFVRGENCYLYDSHGTRYVDLESGIWCTALGHSHPRIRQVMQSQIEQVIHLNNRYPSPLAEAAAMDVLDISGVGAGKCVFLSSGSEAVEFGVQAARRVTGRNRLLTFQSSYLSAYGSAGRKGADEWELLDWTDCAALDTHACLEKIDFASLGGFVLEPGGSGSGFVKFPPRELVRDIAQRVQRAGGLVVANEITTGMGRTGKWFGFQHYDVQPDIVAVGKGLGNGYPVSAVAMSAGVAAGLEDGGFHYAQSHQNDPLGCAVAREVITTMREDHLVERGNVLGAYFLEGLQQLQQKHDFVKEARGRGLLLGLELYSQGPLPVQAIYEALLERGFLVGYYPAGNVVRFDPALTVEKENITHLLETLGEILQTVGAVGPLTRAAAG